jgi:hypothetical protein
MKSVQSFIIYLFVLIAVTAFMLVISCSTSRIAYHELKLLDDQKLQKGKLAVISGDSSEFSKRIAYHLTDELEKSGLFLLVKQEEIETLMPKYPEKIVDFRLRGTKNIDKPFITATTQSALLEINKKLRTKYLYLIWVEDVYVESSRYGERLCVLAFGRLLAYPENKVIAFTNDWPCQGSLSSNSSEKAIDGFMKKIAKDIAKTISKSTE